MVGPRACLGTTSAIMQAGAAGSGLAEGRQCAAQPEAWRCPSPGVRGPVFGEPPALPHAGAVSLGEGQGSEVDVSDLGSRNYSARTDFYCLVSEDDAGALGLPGCRGQGWVFLVPHPRGERSGPQTGQDPSHALGSGTLVPREAAQAGVLQRGRWGGWQRDESAHHPRRVLRSPQGTGSPQRCPGKQVSTLG